MSANGAPENTTFMWVEEEMFPNSYPMMDEVVKERNPLDKIPSGAVPTFTLNEILERLPCPSLQMGIDMHYYVSCKFYNKDGTSDLVTRSSEKSFLDAAYKLYKLLLIKTRSKDELIFKDAKFGDRFKTKNDKIAYYFKKDVLNEMEYHYCIVDGEVTLSIYFNNGTNITPYVGLNIIEKMP